MFLDESGQAACFSVCNTAPQSVFLGGILFSVCNTAPQSVFLDEIWSSCCFGVCNTAVQLLILNNNTIDLHFVHCQLKDVCVAVAVVLMFVTQHPKSWMF